MIDEETQHYVDSEKNIDMEIDGLLVYEKGFVYIETKATVADKKVVEGAIKKARDLSTLEDLKCLECFGKEALIVLQTDLVKRPDQEKLPGTSARDIKDHIQQNRVFRLSPNGKDYGYVHYNSDSKEDEIQTCSPPDTCECFCQHVHHYVHDFSQTVVYE